MVFATIPDFVLASSQDIHELVLSGRLDLAPLDGRAAAALAHETFASRARTRKPLQRSDLLHTSAALQGYQEVLAFVIAWVDSVLQATPAKVDWIAVRQRRYGEVLAILQRSGQLTVQEARFLDDLVVKRSSEYGPSPFDASIALGNHLAPLYGDDSLFLATAAGAYLAGASVELFNGAEFASMDSR